MMRVASGLSEPDEPNEPGGPDPELTIRITAPIDYAAASMGALAACDGLVTELKADSDNVVVFGSLPLSWYAELVKRIAECTQGRGSVEYDLPSANYPNPDVE